MIPVAYPLCNQTVTVYRKDGTRLVLTGVWYQWEDRLHREAEGDRWERIFLLVVPGKEQQVFVGDRVYPGIGPEEILWREFIPANVPGLSEADYAKLLFCNGIPCHTQAGRK